MACFKSRATNDRINATETADVIVGLSGDDYLVGDDDADRIIGGAGYDEIYGKGGRDKLFGGRDSDILFGGDGGDRIDGGKGGDILRGEAGNDRLWGGDGFDFLVGESGSDLLDGGAGDDRLIGGSGNDRIDGGTGRDVLVGDAGDDVLSGSNGDDAMFGGSGLDRFDGGDGDDTVSFLDAAVRYGIVVDLRSDGLVDDGSGNMESLASIEGVYGTTFVDALTGTKDDNQFGAGAGDTIYALGGDDIVTVSSAAGATLNGGSGSDTLIIEAVAPRIEDGKIVYDQASQGVSVDLTRGKILNDGFGGSATVAGFENVTSSDGNDILLGSAADNHLYGDYGDDHLFGGARDDILSGGYGADTLRGGLGNDIFGFGIEDEFIANVGYLETDTIEDFTKGDKLDILPSGIPLVFIGTEDFDDRSLAIRYEIQGGDTLIEVRSDTLGNSSAFSIKLTGVHALTADDFLHLNQHTSSGAAYHLPTLLPASHFADFGLVAIA